MKPNITKAELGLKRRCLQEGHDAKGVSIVHPRTGQGFHLENPRAPEMGLQHDAPTGENDALGRRHHGHKQNASKGFRPELPNPGKHARSR